MNYVKVIILKPNKSFDTEYIYAVPDQFKNIVKLGMHINIPFGKQNKIVNGIITDLCNESKIDTTKIKYISSINDPEVIITANSIKLAKWMSEKYFTPLSICLKLFIPNKISKSKPLRNTEVENNLINHISDKQNNLIKLTPNQINAIDLINNNNCNCEAILLHGVTGSGKTEVYFNLLEKIITEHKQAIVLLPEIALTTHMQDLFLERFKNNVSIMHSKLTQQEKFNNWKLASQGKINIMLGPRSALFTPFKNIGLIIIDEEHESCYFSETSPKYSAREVAKKICELYHAKLILGSATPSLETYYNTINKKIFLVELPTRINKKMPEVKIVDMRKELLEGNTNIFSNQLLLAMQNAIHNHEQVILFLNRRGYSNFISCLECGYVLKCDFCDISYTYHVTDDSLICHYCGSKIKLTKKCKACGSKYIKALGIGTEKVEIEIKKIFSNINVIRMDSDVIKKKSDYEKALKLFKNKDADILIGTQMIAKGLDFPNVSVVGMILADISLNSSDFRCAENTFQLVTQVSGRAGRSLTSGTAFIQTYNPNHYSIVCAQQNNYKAFYDQEIKFRCRMSYPPFSNIFSILMFSTNEILLIKKIITLKDILVYCDKRKQFKILGPAPASISKIKNNFRYKLFIMHTNEDVLKKFVLFCIDLFKKYYCSSDIKINLTINPINTV